MNRLKTTVGRNIRTRKYKKAHGRRRKVLNDIGEKRKNCDAPIPDAKKVKILEKPGREKRKREDDLQEEKINTRLDFTVENFDSAFIKNSPTDQHTKPCPNIGESNQSKNTFSIHCTNVKEKEGKQKKEDSYDLHIGKISKHNQKSAAILDCDRK